MGADEYRVMNVPRVSVFQSANQAVATGTISNIPWDTVEYDTDSMWTSTGGGFWLTANTPGLYLVHGCGVWAFNATSYREMIIYKWLAGVGTAGPICTHGVVEPSAVTITAPSVTAYVPLNKGDQVTLAVSHNIGGNLNFNGASATVRENGFQACLVSTLG